MRLYQELKIYMKEHKLIRIALWLYAISGVTALSLFIYLNWRGVCGADNNELIILYGLLLFVKSLAIAGSLLFLVSNGLESYRNMRKKSLKQRIIDIESGNEGLKC